MNDILNEEKEYNNIYAMYPVLDKFNVVLEVKFNGFLLDYIRQFINSINKSELSVSKYALARQQSYDEI